MAELIMFIGSASAILKWSGQGPKHSRGSGGMPPKKFMNLGLQGLAPGAI